MAAPRYPDIVANGDFPIPQEKFLSDKKEEPVGSAGENASLGAGGEFARRSKGAKRMAY